MDKYISELKIKAQKYDKILDILEPYLEHKDYICLIEKIREVIES